MIKHQNKIIAKKAVGMGAKNINGELRSTVTKTGSDDRAAAEGIPCYDRSAGQRTQSLNCDFERAGIANPKVSDRLEHLKPTKKDLMISKIISGAACLAELTSNPKSFYNCPDLHGGVPGLPGR
jgi:hypothetical protein